jgi:hypothetical protein
MEYQRVVKTLRSGRVEAEITLGQAQGGSWYYNTRLFRSFTDPVTKEANAEGLTRLANTTWQTS